MNKGQVAMFTCETWGPLGHPVVITRDRGDHKFEQAEFIALFGEHYEEILLMDSEIELIPGVTA